MYIPKHFREEDEQEIENFIKANSFGIIVSVQEGIPIGTHIPFMIEKRDGELILRAHIARANTQKESLTDGAKVLVIFPGPHTYISSTWYKNTSVPTWNFMSVHAYGTLRLIDDEELHKSLSDLVKVNEGEGGHDITSYPDDYVRKLMNGVIGFEITVNEIQAKYKLSQNKNEDDREGVYKGLSEREDEQSGEIMKEMKRKNKE
ncbi:MAG: FMN-binding negative transcriptional regulator [Ignavibacteriae bacterium]|nr:FMN-binding negative transcriptional regulator [Ignavibacteriota bacterium]MCB9244665.1 FMN-binding negative transcriptional regulator [Ignavibacteriales bacterium]